MTKQDKKMSWKRLFISLLILNITGFILMLAFILWPVGGADKPEVAPTPEGEGSEFVVQTSKKNLEDLVNAYLDKFLEETKHQYSVTLDDDVHLQGELSVFSTSVPLSIHLEPLVQDDGNVILKQKSISIGLLELPNKKIMEYLKKYLPMPEWVTVNPEEEEIYVAVSEMDIKSNFQVSVNNLDIEANNIALKITVPYESLGIEPTEQ